MKFIDNLKLNARFNVFIAILLILVFSSLGFYLYRSQKQEIFNKADQQLLVLLEDLINIFAVQTELKQENVNSSMQFVEFIFNKTGGISEVDSFMTVEIKNPKEIHTKYARLRVWKHNNQTLQGNRTFVNFVTRQGIAIISIYQRFEDGYARISTSIVDDQGEPAYNTYLENNNPVSKALSSGQNFVGRAYVYDKWCLTNYQPIVIDGKVKGALCVAYPQLDYEKMKPIIYGKRYFESGYPYVVSGDGFSLINPNPKIEGSDLNGTNFFANLERCKENNLEKFRYKWPENETGQWKWTYLKYFEPLDLYIATSVFEYELYSGLTKLRNGIIIGVIFAIIVFFLGITLIIRPITSSITQLVDIIHDMSKGKSVKKIYYKRKDEIGDIINSINVLIQGLSETARFSNEIEKGNFESHFTPLSNDDTLGKSLLDMRKSLREAKKEEFKRKQEDNQRQWASDGLSKFNDILRQSISIGKLADHIIAELIEFLEANQGGIFLYNDDDKNNVYFELLSAYAYNRKKYVKKTIQKGEGLIGACALEKHTIYLVEIPPEYIEITSGLGGATPTTLLIVPLKVDTEVYGVLEIASFKEFMPYQINFVERLAENIASTLSTAKINTRTSLLLKEAQENSEAMAAQEEEMRQNLEELQATQEESNRREAEMRGIVSALDASFLVSELSLDGRIIKINEEFLNTLNLREDEVLGKKHASFIKKKKYQKQHETTWNEVLNGNRRNLTIQIYAKGKEIWLSETYTPILDEAGKPYKVLNIAIDVTENKKQEIEIKQLLLESRRKTKKLSAQERLNFFNLEKLEKAQTKYIKNEIELKGIIDSIDHTMMRCEYETDGRLRTANQHFLDIMECRFEEVDGRSSKMFIPEDELTAYDNAWRRVNAGEIYEGIVRRVTKSSKEIWLLISYTPIKDPKGNITKILFLGNDITKQKYSEQRAKSQAMKLLEKNKRNKQTTKKLQQYEIQLTQSKNELNALHEAINSTTYMITYDFEGNIVDVSDYALNKLGKKRDELIGKNHKDSIKIENKEQQDAYEQLWKDLTGGEIVNQINCSVIKGKAFWLAETYTPIFDNERKPVKVIKISQDISQNIIDEGELRETITRMKKGEQIKNNDN